MLSDPPRLFNSPGSVLQLYKPDPVVVPLRRLLKLGGGLTVDDDCVATDEDGRLPLYNALLEWINANR